MSSGALSEGARTWHHGLVAEWWAESGERSRPADGREYEFHRRALALDPLDQTLVLEIRAEKFRVGRLVGAKAHVLSIRMYFPIELGLLLERAGFADVDIRGDHNDRRRPRTTSSSSASRALTASRRAGSRAPSRR